MKVRALDEQLRTVQGMPYGADRVRAAEDCVTRADALADERSAVRARLLLVDSYGLLDAERPRLFTPFTWLLARWDDSPELFDPQDRHAFLWYFKWATVFVLDHPEVPLARIEQALVDMHERYSRAGEPLAPYEQSRYKVHRHVLGEEHPLTRQAYEAWIRLPRSTLSDCVACEPTDRALRLAALGRDDEAVEVALPVLAQGGCYDQPHRMADAVVGALVRLGRPEQAAAEHSRAVRLHASRTGDGAGLADQLLVSTQVGRHGRALDLLTRALHHVDQHPAAAERMRLAAAGARLLGALEDAGHGGVELSARRPSGRFALPRSVSAVRADLTETAEGLAAAFDARNGTSAVGDRVRAVLQAPDLPSVPGWPAAQRFRGLDRRERRAAGAAVGVPAQVRHPDPPVARLDGLLALRERAEVSGAAALWDELAERWSAARPAVVHEDALAAGRAGDIARLDVAVTLHGLFPPTGPTGDDDESAAALAECSAALRSAGLVAQALLLEQQGVSAAAARGDLAPLDALGRCADLARECRQVGTDGEAGQAQTAVALLAWQLLRRSADEETAADGGTDGGTPGSGPASAGTGQALLDGYRRGVDLAESLFEQVPPDELTGADRARWARALLLRSEDLDDEPALALVEAALAVVPEGTRARERAFALFARGTRLAALDEVAEAVEALDGATRSAREAGDPWSALSAATRAADTLLDDGEPDEAAERLLGALDDVVALTDDPLWRLRADLVHALNAAGRPLEAARFADDALDLLGDFAPDEDDPESAFHAGRFAHACAVALHVLEEDAAACRLAEAAAAVHRLHHVAGLRARSLDLAAMTCDDVTRRVRLAAEALDVALAAGDRWHAADLFRRYADAVEDADGPDAALAVVERARDHLAAPADAQDDGLRRWHLAALAHFTGSVLVRAERFDEALGPIEEAVTGYEDVGDGDDHAAATSLLAAALHAEGLTEHAVEVARTAAEAAHLAGEAEQARRLGTTLARMLDEGGDPEAADRAWRRYGGG